MAAAGYDHYEISNWARPGKRCAHNLVYWQHREYLGLGAGAHSYFNGVRFSTVLLPNRYVELVQEAAAGTGDRSMRHLMNVEPITPEVAMSDALILGLRLTDGIDVDDFTRRFGANPDERFSDVLREFEGYGLLERTGRRIRLTRAGRLVSNELFERLLPEAAPA